MAIVQVSMHDSVNGITRQYKMYLPPADAGQCLAYRCGYCGGQ